MHNKTVALNDAKIRAGHDNVAALQADVARLQAQADAAEAHRAVAKAAEAVAAQQKKDMSDALAEHREYLDHFPPFTPVRMPPGVTQKCLLTLSVCIYPAVCHMNRKLTAQFAGFPCRSN